MQRFRSLRLVFCLTTLTLGAAGAPSASEHRTKAENTLLRLRALTAEQQLVEGPLTQAERALIRADGARAAAHPAHATALEALAREWAEMALSLVAAANLEKELHSVQTRIGRTEAKTLRARALIDETLARKHRAMAKLEELEKQTRPSAAPAK